MNTAEKMCDFICMIFQGKKVLDGTLSSIQDQYGQDILRVRLDGDATALRDLPGVEWVNDHGQLQELRITDGRDSQQILQAILPRARVRYFELARPSLHDIFVRIAGPEAKENLHA
jgi:ABC-2 type transport system ATP-binding protein